MNKVIGIAGCGSMGLPMAERLLAAGFDVIGYDVRASEEFGDFATRMVVDPSEFARRIDILISVVRNTQQTDDLLFNEQAVLSHPNSPRLLVISSTLSPRFVRDIQNRLPTDVEMLDAPMSGAPYRARSGELTFMLGGAKETVAELMPLFHAMGSNVEHLGPVSHGMTVKVLNNYSAATCLVATRRVLEMAGHLGIDKGRLLSVMKRSSGSNWYADNIRSIDWSEEAYAPDNTIGIVEKDVKSALDAILADPVEADLATTNWTLDEALLDGLRRLEQLDLSQLNQSGTDDTA